MFLEKNILVGIAGGIAVYKTAELVRELKKNGANVRVIMTPAATEFVAPITFETLSENDVLTDLFPKGYSRQTAHIDWARWADVFVICPATLNTIGKIASGIADNALTTTIMAADIPVLFCPAMNKVMYANPIHQANQEKLRNLGYRIIEPGVGELACGEYGSGRLAELSVILDHINIALFGKDDFKGKRVLVSAGPTEEPLDPVRFMSNRSSGKMGFALAERAALRGAKVTLVSGPAQLRPFTGVDLVSVRTADEMDKEIGNRLADTDILIMAAAVSDYRPKHISTEKVKKSGQEIHLELVQNQDILYKAGLHKNNRIHVGFSVETGNEISATVEKLQKKNCDLMVLNNPLEEGAGFQTDTNKVTLINRDGNTEKLELMSKQNVADEILDRIYKLSVHV